MKIIIETVTDKLKGQGLFICGMICLLALNVPNIWAAITLGQTMHWSAALLLQMGLMFYLADAIVHKRPSMFVVSGVLNSSLNLIVLILALVNL